MLKGKDASSLEFPTWNPALSFGKTQNDLLKTIYIGIIEGISDTLSVDYDKDAMTRDLERVQSMLFSVSHQNFCSVMAISRKSWGFSMPTARNKLS